MYRSFYAISVRAALLLVGLVCVLGAETSNIVFSDIPENHWAKDPVYRMVNQMRVAKGYEDGTFRGNEKVSRYETMTYLNNLSLSMEIIMDQKLRGDSASGNTVQELRQEVAEMRARLNAIEGKSSEDSEFLEFLKDKISLEIISATDKSNSVAPTYDVHPRDRDDDFSSVYARWNFRLGRYGLHGYEFLMQDNYGGVSAWTTKYFSPQTWVKLDGSVGQGQVIDWHDMKVIETPDTSMGLTLGLWGLELGIRQGITDLDGTEIAYDFDDDVGADIRFVDKTISTARYPLPLKIPFFNELTLQYGVENYYTEPQFPGYARTLRYLNGWRFDLDKAENRYIELLAIKEKREATEGDGISFDIDQRQPGRNHSQYYQAVISLGDLFNRGTQITIMGAQRDLDFGQNGLGENLAGVNLMGYSSADYLTDRMPTADVTTEYGIEIKQKLFKSNFLATVIFLHGEARPDRNISDYESAEGYDVYKDCYYLYDQHIIRLDWYLRPGSSLYLEHEQTDLHDSTLVSQTQYFLVTNKVGARFAF